VPRRDVGNQPWQAATAVSVLPLVLLRSARRWPCRAQARQMGVRSTTQQVIGSRMSQQPFLIPVEDLRLMFDLDVETGVIRWKIRPQHHFKTPRECKGFNTQFAGKTCGSLGARGYLQCRITVGGKCKLFYAHRIVWALHCGSWPANQVDHINGDRTDNRPCNLREATQAQNSRNRPGSPDSLTGVKGVDLDRRRGKFRARITTSGKEHWLGRFNTVEEAEAAYASAAVSMHGEFAKMTGRKAKSTAGRDERVWEVVDKP